MADTPIAVHVRPAGDVAEDPSSILCAFESDDPGLHVRAAQWIRQHVETEGLTQDQYRSLAGEFHENIECLESQEISRYATMFLGRHPETGAPLDPIQRWVWNHRGQISDQAKKRLRGLVETLPEQIEICEVGSFIGRGSTRAFIDAFRKLGKRGRIFCVDPWDPQVHFDFFRANIRQFGAEDIVTPVQSTSTEASLDFEDERFDVVYIDDAHDYESVMSDLCSWYPKVKPGGMICGDDGEGRSSQRILDHVLERGHLDADYELCVSEGEGRHRVGGHPGVIRAVEEFFHGKATVGTFDEKQWFFVKE